MLDLRLPIGLMFSTVGILMAAYGLVTSSNIELYRRSLDINVNLWWGLFLVIFGVLMFVAGYRAQAQDDPKK